MTAPQPNPVVVAMAAYVCPDCISEASLSSIGGVWLLEVAHDPGCPWLAAHDHPDHRVPPDRTEGE